jgi:hypothetical protein
VVRALSDVRLEVVKNTVGERRTLCETSGWESSDLRELTVEAVEAPRPLALGARFS